MPFYECRGKNKLWSVRWREYQFGKETNHRLGGYKTKRECQQAYIDYINERDRKKEGAKDLTFMSLYQEYGDYVKQRNKLSTHYDFVSKTKLHILPYFKDYLVKDITPKLILDWQNSINDYSYQYKCHLRNCLSGMLTYADKYYDIPNQLKRVDGFRNLEFKEEMKVWTPEEFEQVMEHITDIVYKTFYYALFYTGCRKGEMLATTWKDWDFKNHTININKSISKKVTGASWIVTTPKNTSSNRKIKVPEMIFDMLKLVKQKQIDDNISGDMVFYGSSPLPETCICRHLKNASKKAEIHDIRIHDFRHSHASFLISQGATIVSVAKRLGHSSVEQTLNTYSHLMPSDEDKLINILNKK